MAETADNPLTNDVDIETDIDRQFELARVGHGVAGPTFDSSR
jgi:hypothetical protein